MRKAPSAVLLASIALCALFFIPQMVRAETLITPFLGSNAGTQVWTKAGSPYVVDGSVYMRYGSLTIEPGVVVKFMPNALLSIHADVPTHIAGTLAEPIYFTSIKDDSVGGDTNGDDTATEPLPGDWGYLYLGGGSWNDDMHIGYIKVRYGGSGTPSCNTDTFPTGGGPQLILHFQWFSGNSGKAYSVSHIESSRSAGLGLCLYVGTHNSVTVSDSSFYNNPTYGLYRARVYTLSGYPIAGAVTVINNWWGDPSGPYHETLNPTGLGNPIGPTPSQYETYSFSPWLSADPMPDPVPEPDSLDPVIVVPGILGSMPDDDGWKLDPILHIYDNLVETLDANEYTLGVDLFPFPYDWKNSNVDTAVALKAKIDEVKASCSCSQVDIVAHSMGGLVARQYIQSSDYENDVDQLIFLGTPHLGAPQAYLMYEGGENGEKIQDVLMQLFLSHLAHEAGYEDTFEYIHLGPIASVRELLPVYDYLSDSAGTALNYPNGYPTNPFLENLRDTASGLDASGVLVTNIVGENQLTDTIVSISVEDPPVLPKWPHGVPLGFLDGNKSEGLQNGTGDGTVPTISSSFINDAPHVLFSRHNQLPTDAQSVVYEYLTGEIPSVVINKPFLDRFLVFRVFSPVDIQVIAPDNKRVGKDFQNPNNDLNEILDAFYSGFGTEAEFIVIPNPLDGEYRIITEGTGSGGSYAVSTSYVTDSLIATKEYTDSALPGVQAEVPVILDSTSPDPVALVDITPPELQVSSPLEGATYMHSANHPIEVSAEDADSGVASVQTWLDGEEIVATEIDLFFKSLGSHILSVSATDNEGNATSTSVAFSVITTPEDTILDIERAYTLGWIVKTGTKNSLIQKVKKAIRIEKKITFFEEKLPGKPKVIKRIEKLESKLDRTLGLEIIKELDQQLAKGNITQDGYNVIKADVEWLLGHI